MQQSEQLSMTTQQDARKLNTEERQETNLRQESMTHRAAQEVENPPANGTEEKARESMAQQRQHEELREESMSERATE
jgi:hypothetical protein